MCQHDYVIGCTYLIDAMIIQTAAHATLFILWSHNLHACLFGSAACAMYGMRHRDPNVSPILPTTA